MTSTRSRRTGDGRDGIELIAAIIPITFGLIAFTEIAWT